MGGISRERIVEADRVPEGSTLVFRVRERGVAGSVPDDGGADRPEPIREGILVRSGDGIVGWLNRCQHLLDVPLDKGSGASMRDGEIVCENHGAMFEAASGRCTFGPCEGAFLEGIDVEVGVGPEGDDEQVWLVDGRFDLVGLGPIERDPLDRGSRSNVEF